MIENFVQKFLNKEYSKLNNMQREAVFRSRGPLLVLAGAGSGKTTVIVNKIAYLIKYGDAYYSNNNLSENEEKYLKDYLDKKHDDKETCEQIVAYNPISPYSILAITFTNKAAKELKERISKIAGYGGEQVWASTFHSMCAKMLRRDIELLGYKRDFTIYDTEDCSKIIKECLSQLNIDERNCPPKTVLNAISKAKDAQIEPDEFSKEFSDNFNAERVAKVYALYTQRLKTANALDFDDLILLTVKLLSEFEHIRQYYQNRFKYVLVDEYQDTNMLQYKLISLLVNKDNNICVVGDDDQSIYKFRGATIENILQFEHRYNDAKVIRLEENYRSTKNILDAANEVIKHNFMRKGKNLWTSSERGSKVTVKQLENGEGEAQFIRRTIESLIVDEGYQYRDIAILYRTNSQSRIIEQVLRYSSIPAKIVGGVGFFDRKEIKDMLAYMSVIANETDNLRLKRIINEPSRKIGKQTLDKVEAIANMYGISLFEVIQNANEYPQLQRVCDKLVEFAELINHLKFKAQTEDLVSLYNEIIYKTGYLDMLKEENSEESKERIRNLEEMASAIREFCESHEESSLSVFLEETALLSDLDNLDDEGNFVTLMTLHSAKGLEFDCVFMVGMEDGLFPSNQSMFQPDDIEEERRLCYVGITRAKKKLYMLHCSSRMIYGSYTPCMPSRFLSELPDDCVEKDRVKAYAQKPALDTSAIKKPYTSYGSSEKDVKTYAVGECVEHKIFGRGVILSVKPMGNDSLLEISFDSKGVKRIMANYANLTKV